MLLAQTSPLKTARGTTLSRRDPVEPTPEEAANGWTPDKLAEHVAQVEARELAGLMHRLFPEKPPLRVEPTASFDPHTW